MQSNTTDKLAGKIIFISIKFKISNLNFKILNSQSNKINIPLIVIRYNNFPIICIRKLLLI